MTGNKPLSVEEIINAKAWKLCLFFIDHGAKFESRSNATSMIETILRSAYAQGIEDGKKECKENHGH